VCAAYGEREAVAMQQRVTAAANDYSRSSAVQLATFKPLYLVEDDGELFAASVLQHASELDRELRRT